MAFKLMQNFAVESEGASGSIHPEGFGQFIKCCVNYTSFK